MQGFPWWSLEHLPECESWMVKDIGANLSNRTWLVTNKKAGTQVTSKTAKYLIKQFRHGEEFGRDHQRVLNIDHYVAEMGIGPQVVYVNEEKGVVIYEHLSNPLLLTVNDVTERIQRLAQALAQVHSLTPSLKQVSLRAQLETYCDSLASFKPNDAARMREDVESYRSLFDKCEQQPQVFCHNDLSMNHVFVTPELKVIDWEYAGYNHPGLDLAMAVAMNDLYDDEIDVLFDEYNLHSKHKVSRDDLPDWLRVVALVNRIWFKVQEAIVQGAAAIEVESEQAMSS